MSDNIKVVVKVRPLISREIEDKLSFQWKVKNNTLYQLDSNGKESGVQYTFDKVYDVTTETEDVYKDVAQPIVEAAIAGFNGTIFAYGQTSSGKTYTMSGTETSPGIIQLAVMNLFHQIKCIPDRDFLVRVSFIEIYNETLKDLLNCENDKVKIRDTVHGSIKLEATEKFTSSPEEVLDIMKEGEMNRQTGATNMNEQSSRSHSIFQITIESREHTEDEETAGCVNVSQLNLVDLAGSERAGQTGATGKRFKEGTHINKSLSVLALVIKQLSEGPQNKHVNYRDSKLTRLLQNSLGGNAKTSIICAVTPAAVEETISTLQFANRAKAVKNTPEVNAVATDATKLQDLTKQLCKLQSELAIKNSIEQDNRKLMDKIESLRKMILNGFSARSFDVGGARRKTWSAPRRMTIAAAELHHSPLKHAVQRFCTPSLKYNPLSLPTPREPVQRPSQLPSVSEERVMMTPPPKDKKVNFSDEIIDLDSDEDNASNSSHCSPYHKCFTASKTPPCVLRKKAKTAEKDLKDIVELTKREKLYNPEVVEYMEKLEQSTKQISNLEDEIESLNALNIAKDSEIDKLKDNISQIKVEVDTFSSAKTELETRCKEYNTKLTDLEVIYETLKTKAKLREGELLSLINEQSGKRKVKESSKSLSRTLDKDFGNFMDMSKDISLVSDNDSSIDSSNNEPSGQLQRLVDEMRTDVNTKHEVIVNLEADILQQKLKIESLESTCTELRDQIEKTNNRLKYTEEENTLLKSSIDTLNSTIKSQKQNLESANSDIQSYNIVIKDLQAKLVDKKSDNVDFCLNDISLERMIANEEKFIANNENMRNIIHSFKIMLESRNKEIEQLRSNHTSETCSSDTELLTKLLEEKEKEIISLIEEAHTSKEQIGKNISVINKLMEDNMNLVKNSDELSDKLLNAEKQCCEFERRIKDLEKENVEYVHQLRDLNDNHDRLVNASAGTELLNKQLEEKEEEVKRLTEETNNSKKQIQENINVINKLLEENKNLGKNTDDLSDKLLSASSDTDLLKKQVEEKEKEIMRLIEASQNTKEQIQENMNVIKKLMQDNMDLVQNADDLTNKLLNSEKQSCELEKRVTELEKQNQEYTNQLQEFSENNEKLLINLNEFKNKIIILEKEKEAYQEVHHEVHSKDNLIDELKSEILTKEDLISSLSSQQSEYKDYISKWKSSVNKVQLLLLKHIADTNELELLPDNTSNIDELCSQINSIENAANTIIIQKETTANNCNKLQVEIEELQTQVKSLVSDNNNLTDERDKQRYLVSELTTELEYVKKELFELNKQNLDLNEKLQIAKESYEILNRGIMEKEQLITLIKNEENSLRLQLEKALTVDVMSRKEDENLHSTVQNSQTDFDTILQTEKDEIKNLKREFAEKEKLLDEKGLELQQLSKKHEETIGNQNCLLENIHKAAASLLNNIDDQNEEYYIENSSHSNVYNKIIYILDRAKNYVIMSKSNDDIKEIVELLEVMKEQNQQLISKLSYTENENSRLITDLEQMKINNDKISMDLFKSDELLKRLQTELREKLYMIENLESKVEEWKNNFSVLEDAMKQQLLELQISRSDLESQSQSSVKRSLSIKSIEQFTVGPEFSDLDSSQKQSIRRSLTNLLVEPGNYSPQSLLTLCCNRIIDAIQPSESELNSGSTSTDNFRTTSAETQTDVCDCDRLLAEKCIAIDENLELKAQIDYLEDININLLKEEEEVRKELKFLLEPALELQKKISSHRTNLSTLTATTYAENKLLKSQVKVLQHHNNRMYNVCQREIPGFKKSLQELSLILKHTPLVNRLEANIKRFSLPELLDRNSSTFKDESTLDGDLLMLDTNVTLASVDNTLLAQDQTCLDGTQIYLDTEINTDVIETIDPNILHTQLQMLSAENEKITEKLTVIKAENLSLHEIIEKLSKTSKPDILKVDAQNSPMKLCSAMNDVSQETIVNNGLTNNLCEYCKNGYINHSYEKMTEDIDKLTQELLEVKLQKSDLEKRYNNLNEDLLANDRLALKISALEKDNNKHLILIDQLTKKLTFKHEEYVKLQEENELLSEQVMESIDDCDILRKEVEALKEKNTALSTKRVELGNLIESNAVSCTRCVQITSASNSPSAPKSALNRSRSDSESSSRCNKLSTLQNELMAGREDCRTISEDVATIKSQLERGELSMTHDMDLDDSMGESNVFSFTKELHVVSPKPNKFNAASDIPEEGSVDFYALDKLDCFNFYIEKTGAENHCTDEIKIIDIMKMFYDNLVARHGNEVENLVNKLKDFEESKHQLNESINQLTFEYSKVSEEIKEKDNRLVSIAHTLQQIRDNLHSLNEEMSGCDSDKNTVLVTQFKSNILSVMDKDFDIASVIVFENLIDKVVNKHKNDLLDMMNRYSELQGHMELLTTEFSSVTDNLNQMKCQLSEKEKEYNLLKAQKEKVHEITSAVTRDIVQREKDLAKLISAGCLKLIEHNILTQSDIDQNWAVDRKLTVLIEKLLDQSNQTDLALQEKHNLALEVTKSKTILEDNCQEIEALKSQVEQLHELCKNATNELMIKNNDLETLKSLHEQLNEVYKRKVEENVTNTKTVEILTQELDIIKTTMKEKDSLLLSLQLQNTEQNGNNSETEAKIAELMESINNLQHENKNLKSVNDVITNESEQNALQLAQADDTIKRNKTELDKLTAEILTLNQSMKESTRVIEDLKMEAKSLVEQNAVLKKQFEEATGLCSQLKLNIKTHEKTAEIQCKIISRLKEEKESRSSSTNVQDEELKKLSEQCETLRKELEALTEDKNKSQQEAQQLREAKESLERRVIELESTKARSSLSGTGDTRRRRQSLLDSKRVFGDDKEPDHKKLEAYFSSQEKPDDLFMDVDEHSNRSTPARNRRSDSFQSRHDDSEELPRPSSAQERRRRRQSLHDNNRTTHIEIEPMTTLNELKTNGSDNSEVASLRDRLELCQQELEELRERYREVDEECETCAEYLRERDEQCVQLKAKNNDLQQQIAKLNDKLQNASIVRGQKDALRTFANASVNTDEDWANLHSVVVDRMSFDREVEKNKTLQRTVDELRFKNGELKAAIAKMHKSVERAAANKANLQELQATKLELETCKRELEEFKERCRELDEECETCGEYLRERDSQLCRLREERDALEAKLEAIVEKEAGSKVQSVRKKRQSMHDQNRHSAVCSQDAATGTAADLYQENDSLKLTNESSQNTEIVQLKMALETMSRQKQVLEQQLRAPAPATVPPVLVATGSAIVQNQHLTEVMKENQKLKKMNAKLITICKKRGKPLGESNRENDDPELA
ncbi:centromere-associated protein E-like [Leguminivora glycinivorella]|uniref:centromere-associated protein E-like n=1 Tax=Leguminivora glycinivorella TaxID=1035111 RepID=UPI00200C5AFF|nr:centromere-associated protein E-like [Leguminivora glycinivorella]